MSKSLIPINEIVLDPRLQMRATMDFDAIDEYAENIDKLPPCKAVKTPDMGILLTAGWHRYQSHKKAEKDTLPCIVRDGTFLDALVEACGENEAHGIRRKPEDKRRTVSALLNTPEWSGKSDRLIADACHVSHTFVSQIRSTGNVASSQNGHTKRMGKDKKLRPVTTSGMCEACKTRERKHQPKRHACPDCKALRRQKKSARANAPSEVNDNFGNAIPAKLKHAWNDQWIQTTYDLLAGMLDNLLQARLPDAVTKRAKHFPFFRHKDISDGCGFIQQYLDQILEHIRDNRPAGVCPKCEGKGCHHCKQSGLVPKAIYEKLAEKVAK